MMRELSTIILSWITVTIIYVGACIYDGLELSFTELPNTVMLWAFVALFTGIYFVLIGGPILYFLFKRSSVSRQAFVIAGLVASLPMLIVSISSNEPEWVISTLAAGLVAGGIFAVRLPNQQST